MVFGVADRPTRGRPRRDAGACGRWAPTSGAAGVRGPPARAARSASTPGRVAPFNGGASKLAEELPDFCWLPTLASFGRRVRRVWTYEGAELDGKARHASRVVGAHVVPAGFSRRLRRAAVEPGVGGRHRDATVVGKNVVVGAVRGVEGDRFARGAIAGAEIGGAVVDRDRADTPGVCSSEGARAGGAVG